LYARLLRIESMRDKIQDRLVELRGELDKGKKIIEDLDAQRAGLQTQLLRIAGAVQVLEQLLEADAASAAPAPTPTPLHATSSAA
jgi:hypothetical protein